MKSKISQFTCTKAQMSDSHEMIIGWDKTDDTIQQPKLILHLVLHFKLVDALRASRYRYKAQQAGSRRNNRVNGTTIKKSFFSKIFCPAAKFY